MAQNRSICRRCHRLQVVDETRCCERCAVVLRGMEKRPARIPVAVEEGETDAGEELIPGEIGETVLASGRMSCEK